MVISIEKYHNVVCTIIENMGLLLHILRFTGIGQGMIFYRIYTCNVSYEFPGVTHMVHYLDFLCPGKIYNIIGNLTFINFSDALYVI